GRVGLGSDMGADELNLCVLRAEAGGSARSGDCVGSEANFSNEQYGRGNCCYQRSVRHAFFSHWGSNWRKIDSWATVREEQAAVKAGTTGKVPHGGTARPP